jgi:dnaB-like helicase N terminal domain|nr:MAG TPA: replicative DNA helicase [Caudoviricetes sp.]
MKKNLELEKQILAKLMIDADLLLENELSEQDFVNPTHKKLLQAIKDSGSNLALIQSKFVEEEQDYILEIAAMLMTSGRKENYAELKRLTEVRRLETILKGLQMAIDDDQSLDLIYEKIAQFDKQEIQVADMKEVLVEIVAELTGTVTAIYHPTGYTKLDKYLR